ncbi:carbamoyltransferase N-terminal domain-containing protein [Kribbella turkmenica]|uniref:carbamoyltransferase N-terminal domain-containing protein n=1 Tax=Kribbella turkmenica TaxID=2530375 RepID=UPI001F364E88|nr:carbamoyltransferase N-terminal domain-containing protein [Kribbella turkmenica]
MQIFRNETGDQEGRGAGLVETFRNGGKGVDDYHVGGAVLGHIKRSCTLGRDLKRALDFDGPTKFDVRLIDHHRAHAASAFFVSPWDEAAVMTFDGIGSDGTSTCLFVGRGNEITDLKRIKFPHSLGALYACVTGYLDFWPTMDEGKVMGLAPFGRDTYIDAFKDLVELGSDGRYELNLDRFQHHRSGKHMMSAKFLKTFGPARERTKVTAENPVPQHYTTSSPSLRPPMTAQRSAQLSRSASPSSMHRDLRADTCTRVRSSPTLRSNWP